MYITRENMSADAFPLTSSTPAGFMDDPTNPNPNHHHQQQQPAQVKKNRKLPGTPDPEAEVIAMSPRALMATNRFVCEICNKGFQRDQNLQLHRRGHNLPWKLKQRTGKEVVRKRVYVCPEKTCIHHDPARALGDLTGIKKHFYRKHGEKKWKCDKCSKKYAVHSDWKAHSKVCGTREYKCDCGTIFSRKDSFITHRAFCDALTEEGARLSTATAAVSGLAFKSSPLMTHDVGGGGGNPYLGLAQDLLPGSIPQLHPLMRHPYASGAAASQDHGTNLSLWLHNNKAASGPHLNPDMDMPPAPDYLAPTSSMSLPELFQMPSAQVMGYGGCPLLPQQGGGANLSLSNPHSTYGFGEEEEKKAQLREASPGSFYSCSGLQATPQQENSTAHMSATALLQKAARMGATSSHHSSSSSSSFLTGTGFGGLIMSSAKSLHPPLKENKDEFRLLLDQKQSAGNFHQDHLLINTLATTGATLGRGGENMAPAANASGMMTVVAAAGREPQLLLPNTWPHQVGRGPTRDFLGVGGEETTRPFLQQELAKFASMDSGMHLMSASYNSSRR